LADRPWVNAYKLMIHLGLGTLLFLYLGYVVINYYKNKRQIVDYQGIKGLKILMIIGFLQILLGGLMSGMKAGLFYPTWPAIDGSWIPNVITYAEHWTWLNMANYDDHEFAPGLIQFLHRMVAYFLFVYGMIWCIKAFRNEHFRIPAVSVFVLLSLQVLLGILTLINCVGSIPVTLGVLHQCFGMLFMLSLIWMYVLKIKPVHVYV
jgi:cytochrome c oxidase assembly protein subunit 15